MPGRIRSERKIFLLIYISRFNYDDLKRGERKKFETANGRYLLREAVRREFGVDSGLFTIEKGEHGKPFFAERDDIFFNISHSGELVAVGVGKCPVGVDVQVVRRVKDSLINKLCNYNEKEFILESTDKDRAFITLWALKESYIKAIGLGMSYPMSEINFDIRNFYGEAEGEFSNRSGRYYVKDYGDFVLAACALGEFDFNVEENINVYTSEFCRNV